MYCTKCGNKLEESNLFCTKCGTKINRNQSNNINENTSKEIEISEEELELIKKQRNNRENSPKNSITYIVSVLVVFIVFFIGVIGISYYTMDINENSSKEKELKEAY